MTRSRTITWEDPQAVLARAASLPGLSYWQEVARGELPPPPMARLLGMDDITEVALGRIVFRLEPGEHLLNPLGSVHGGVHATLLDSAMGCAVHTTLPAGTGYTTLEIKVNYVRPVLLGTGPVLAEGAIVHRGGTVATAEGRLIAERTGTLLAHSTTTCLVLAAAPSRAAAA